MRLSRHREDACAREAFCRQVQARAHRERKGSSPRGSLYTFHYLLPEHHARRVYVFFPDPWPKKKHHSHRLFGPLFRAALWKRLEKGGKIEFATDHAEYFAEVCEGFAADEKFRRVEPMPRPPEVWTEFESMFRDQGLPIYSAAWEALEGDDSPLSPLVIPPEAEPREGIRRRVKADEFTAEEECFENNERNG